MAFAHVGAHQSPAEANPFALVTHTAGDIMLLDLVTTGTAKVTGVAGGGCTWAQLVAPVALSTVSGYGCCWIGTVTAPGTANVTLSFDSGSPSVVRVGADEFSVTGGAAAVSLDDSAALNGQTSTWPTLTPTGSGELYWGYAKNNGSSAAGSTAGFSYGIDSLGNGCAWDTGVSAATAPVWGDSTQTSGVMVLLKESASSGASVAGAGAAAAAAGGTGSASGGAAVTGAAGAVTAAGGAGTPSGGGAVSGTGAAVAATGGTGSLTSGAHVTGTAAAVTARGGTGIAGSPSGPGLLLAIGII